MRSPHQLHRSSYAGKMSDQCGMAADSNARSRFSLEEVKMKKNAFEPYMPKEQCDSMASTVHVMASPILSSGPQNSQLYPHKHSA